MQKRYHQNAPFLLCHQTPIPIYQMLFSTFRSLYYWKNSNFHFISMEKIFSDNEITKVPEMSSKNCDKSSTCNKFKTKRNNRLFVSHKTTRKCVRLPLFCSVFYVFKSKEFSKWQKTVLLPLKEQFHLHFLKIHLLKTCLTRRKKHTQN